MVINLEALCGKDRMFKSPSDRLIQKKISMKEKFDDLCLTTMPLYSQHI
jgi:hypothetical protein